MSASQTADPGSRVGEKGCGRVVIVCCNKRFDIRTMLLLRDGKVMKMQDKHCLISETSLEREAKVIGTSD